METMLNLSSFSTVEKRDLFTINGGGPIGVGTAIAGLVVAVASFALTCLAPPAAPLTIGIAWVGVVVAVVGLAGAVAGA